MEYEIFSIRDNRKVMECETEGKALEQIAIIESDEKENGDFLPNSYEIRKPVYTEKSITLSGKFINLHVAISEGCHCFSKKKYNKDYNKVTVTWTCKDPETDIHDLVDISTIEWYNCEIEGIVA
jgi:hypothetical protein